MSVYDDRLKAAELALTNASHDVSENFALQAGEHKADVLALAQVHATLALAEQQRIANVIAIAQFDTAVNNDGKHLFTGIEAAVIWRMDAITALGLNDGRVK